MLNAIRAALQGRLLTLFQNADVAAQATLLAEDQPRPPQPHRLTVSGHTAFGQVIAAEKNGLSRRTGAFVVTLLSPADAPPDAALALAAQVEALFHRAALPCGPHRLVCAEPHTTDAGLNAHKRRVITVTVQWFMFH